MQKRFFLIIGFLISAVALKAQTPVVLNDYGLPVRFTIPETVEGELSIDSTSYSSFTNWKVRADDYKIEIRGEVNKTNKTTAQYMAMMKKELTSRSAKGIVLTIVSSDGNSAILKTSRTQDNFTAYSAIYLVTKGKMLYSFMGALVNGTPAKAKALLAAFKAAQWSK